MQPISFRRLLPLCALTLLVGGCTDMAQGYSTTSQPSFNQDGAYQRPSLVTTDAPAPSHGMDNAVTGSAVATGMAPPPPADAGNASAPIPLAITPQPAGTMPVQAMSAAPPAPMPVSSHVEALDQTLGALQSDAAGFQDRFNNLQAKNDIDAARYYDTVSSINIALPSSAVGTPALVEKENFAKARLDDISQSVEALKSLAADLQNAAAHAAKLQEEAHATGGYDTSAGDHDRIATLKDGADHQVSLLGHLQQGVNDEINHRADYLRNEQLHIQTLSLAINSRANAGTAIAAGDLPAAMPTKHHRPLVVIRFNRPDVSYEDALYASLSDALKKYPDATFDVVAVSPVKGTRGQMEEAAHDARKNGEAVLNKLAQMGMPAERMHLSAATGPDAATSEVHVYLVQ